MNYIIHYDICAAIMIAINIFFFFSRKHLWDRQSKIYCSILIITFLSCLLDIGTVAVGRFAQIVPESLVWITNTAYLSVFHCIPPLMLFYFWELVGRFETLKPFWKVVTWLPYSCMTALILTSVWTHAIFYVDSDNIYRHGDYHFLYYVAAAMMIILCVRITIVYKKNMDIRKRRAAIAFIVLILLAMLVQMIFERLLLVQFAAALALMMMYLALQEPSSYVDPLTNAYNRAGMIYLIKSYFCREKHFVLLAFGLDDFKKVNGIFGDKHGDELLCRIVSYLGKRYNSHHVVRFGGDWLCVLLDKDYTPDKLTEEISDFPDSWDVHGVLTPVTSCCLALDSADYTNPSQMMLYLQYAQKSAKSNGPGTVMLVDHSTIKLYEREQLIKEKLEKAVRDRSFDVFYQPIIALHKSGRVHSFEALVRLYDTDLGYISPGEFIPLAEKLGLICQIGDIVRDKVFSFLAHNDIRAAGIDHISINLSVIECMRSELGDRVKGEVERYGIDPSTVCFEITESAAAMSISILRSNMEKLAMDGFTFALDDYGTGYSNLAALLSLPFKVVKLDKSVLYSSYPQTDHSYLRSLTSLFHSLNLEVVCEGIETAEQDSRIRDCCMEYAQGYLYSRPLHSSAAQEYAAIPERPIPADAAISKR